MHYLYNSKRAFLFLSGVEKCEEIIHHESFILLFLINPIISNLNRLKYKHIILEEFIQLVIINLKYYMRK